MDYPIKVSVADFAQLALDVYESSDANDVRPGFNKDWIKINTWTSPNQFHASFYKNHLTNIGVIAIRGTVTSVKATLIADAQYVAGEFTAKDMPQLDDAKKYYKFLQNLKFWTDTKKQYVCGHSLGGMLAKGIAPTTGLDTIAFNSPGMRRFLIKNNLPCNLISAKGNIPAQKQITYSSTKDNLIGNGLNLYDNGGYIYVTPPKEVDTIKNELKPLYFHSMKLLYTTIRNGDLRNDTF